jgi:hypothetical protein
MAKWLEKYEQGGLVLKQKTKDNYGVKENPSDSSVSLPPGFVGMGNDISGRNYSPAWGGQFAMGGSIPGSVGFTYARTINPAPSEGPYAKKTMPSAQTGMMLVPSEQQLPVAAGTLEAMGEGMSAPQKAATYLASGKYQTPSEAMGIENPYGAFAVDFLLDPINFIGAGLGKGLVKKGAEQAGKYLTEETALKNAYKINPFAFKPNPESAYRMIGGKEGYLDAINSGEIRAVENGVYGDAHFNMGLPLNPNRLSSEELIKAGSPGGYKGPYMVERRWADNAWNKHAMTDAFKNSPEIQEELIKLGKDKDVWGKYGNLETNDNAVRLYKEHWLQGYKEIPKKEDGGEIPSAQNGEEMKYWQEGLDWKPKSISKNGGWLNKYAEGGELPPEVIVEAAPEVVPLEDVPGEPGNPKSKYTQSALERLMRQAYAESAWREGNISSKVGAVGPLQIMQNAYKDYAKATGDKSPYKSVENFPQAIKVRNWLMDNIANSEFIKGKPQTEEVKLAKIYGAYNWGKTNMANYLNDAKAKGMDIYNSLEWTKDLPKETSNYSNNILFQKDPKFEQGYQQTIKKNPNIKYFKPTRKSGSASFKDGGGITKDDNGYWNPDNWGKPVEIGSNDITMQGVNQPLLGISDTGDTQYMVPGKDYKFKGKKVREYPVAQNGLRQEQKSLQNLDNLLNFTNYNTPQKGGWLQKYSK